MYPYLSGIKEGKFSQKYVTNIAIRLTSDNNEEKFSTSDTSVYSTMSTETNIRPYEDKQQNGNN